MSMELRPGCPDDLDAVVEVFLRCWTVSYRDVLPDEDSAQWDRDRARGLWAPHLAAGGAGVTVAELAGAVLGVIRFGAEGRQGNVHSLYVDPDTAGLGIGRRLVESADAELRRVGCASVSLWVFSANVSAQGFYRRLGFADDGRRRREQGYFSEQTGMTR